MKILMKSITLFSLILTTSLNLQAQSFKTCLNVKVETVEECENAEGCIPKLCDYILEHPINTSDKDAQAARKKVLGWMNVTMNYGFTINEHMMELVKGENLLFFGVYMVAMARGAFTDNKHQDYEALKILAAYIQDPKNGVKMTKPVKKFLKDWKKQKVKKYIDRGTLPE